MEIKNNNNSEYVEPLIVRYLHSRATRYDKCVSSTFEITSRCNFKCKMCYVHSEDCNCHADEELSFEQWESVADQALDAGIVFVLITGGEPLIRNDFSAIYEMLIKKGFVVSVNSNLSLVTEEHIKLFKKYPPSRINASLYGVSDETYQNLCGVPAYSKVEKVIDKLKESGIPVKINSSITPFNCQDIDGIISFCNQKQLNLQTASYMFPSARLSVGRERFVPERAAFYKVLLDLKQLDRQKFLDRAEKVKRGIEYVQSGSCIDPEIKNTGVRCRAGSSSIWIDYKGNMSICGMVPADENNNILRRGFTECYKSVKESTKAIVLPEKCSECKYKYICNVCAASCYSETNAFDKVPTYLCEMSEYIDRYYDEFSKKVKDGEFDED